MQAIETKYIGPTNTKGSRIKASAQAGSVTVGYEHRGSDKEHDAALRALVTKLEWWGVWARGAKVDGTGNVYVCISRAHHPRWIHTPHPKCTDPLDYVVVLPPESKEES